MADVHTPLQRSHNMSQVRSKDTSPERIVRSLIHRRGFRFRLHSTKLPGKPDIVLPKFKAVVFVNGCFWHKHLCPLFKWPRTNVEFWRSKINANAERDSGSMTQLAALGWRVCTVWECAIKGPRKDLERVESQLAKWIPSAKGSVEIGG